MKSRWHQWWLNPWIRADFMLFVLAFLLGWVLSHWLSWATMSGTFALVYVFIVWRRVLGWTQWQSQPLKQDMPTTSVWYRSARLWTERLRKNRRQQKEYIAQLKGLFALFEAVPFAVITLDNRFNIVYFNHQSMPLLGLDAKDHGHYIGGILRRPELLPLWQPAEIESVRLHCQPHGQRICTFQRIGTQDSGYLLLVHDVSKAYAIEQMRQDFIANASHELRTPLTVLLGYLEYLQGDPIVANTPWQQPATQMHVQAKRMKAIVDDLLTLSKLESEHTELNVVDTSIQQLLEQQLSNHSALIESKQQKMRIDWDQDVALSVDVGLLTAALDNLITNAIRYTQSGGRIKVFSREVDDGLEIIVQDNGPGIPHEHLPKLTQRFYRVDKDRSRQAGGTGLGLAIVKHTLERHGGRLIIQSSLAQGSRFICWLPNSVKL